MEERTSKVEADVGNLSEQLDNLMQENAEITRAAKAMIEELSSTLKGENTLPHPKQSLTDLLRGFVERELRGVITGIGSGELERYRES